MKKYKRFILMFSTSKIAIAALYAAMALAFIISITGDLNTWAVICGAIFVGFIFIHLCIVIKSNHYYTLFDSFIQMSLFSIVYRKLKYTDFCCAYIVNASFNNSYAGLLSNNYPMQYKSKGGKATVYPFITLHKTEPPIHKIHSGMFSRELFFLCNEIYCLGICWFDALAELLKCTNLTVCVLEDVYLRYRGAFDQVFLNDQAISSRIYIVTDHQINYLQYLEANSE